MRLRAALNEMPIQFRRFDFTRLRGTRTFQLRLPDQAGTRSLGTRSPGLVRFRLCDPIINVTVGRSTATFNLTARSLAAGTLGLYLTAVSCALQPEVQTKTNGALRQQNETPQRSAAWCWGQLAPDTTGT
jgi:hypothetical protein